MANTTNTTNVVSGVAAARLRLEYLDGLRGLAALFVVLHHAYLEMATGADATAMPSSLLRAFAFLGYGHYAVAVFIVLSGYCLMLPVARSAEGKLRGGFGEYIKRRATRILPPYYAALILSLLLIALVPDMRHTHTPSIRWDGQLPAFEPKSVVAHFLMLHNLSSQWVWRINSVMWSVATEWDIYFLFPLILLPLWRRFGIVASTLLAVVGSSMPYWALPHFNHFEKAAPWYVGLFALGMAGAVINFSRRPFETACRERVPWSLVVLAGGIVFALLPDPGLVYAAQWAKDVALGVAVMSLLVYCTRCLSDTARTRQPRLVRLLSAPWAVALGTFSYSLYLTHLPLLSLFHIPLRAAHLSAPAQYGLLLVVAPPICIAIAYGFHLAFERRFMPGHPHTLRKAETAAALSPAP